MAKSNNIVLFIVIGLGMVLALTLVAGPKLIDKLADRVIEKLQRDYAPGPYNPGFDPDKVDPNKLFDKYTAQHFTNDHRHHQVIEEHIDLNDWNRQWEESRNQD